MAVVINTTNDGTASGSTPFETLLTSAAQAYDGSILSNNLTPVVLGLFALWLITAR